MHEDLCMSRRKSGFRKKTRDKISKSIREKSKFTITALLTAYQAGDRVLLRIDSSFNRNDLTYKQII